MKIFALVLLVFGIALLNPVFIEGNHLFFQTHNLNLVD